MKVTGITRNPYHFHYTVNSLIYRVLHQQQPLWFFIISLPNCGQFL